MPFRWNCPPDSAAGLLESLGVRGSPTVLHEAAQGDQATSLDGTESQPMAARPVSLACA
jgi:hypothetical protein